MNDEAKSLAVRHHEAAWDVFEFGKRVAFCFLEGHGPALQSIDSRFGCEHKCSNRGGAENDSGEQRFLDPVARESGREALLFSIRSHGFHGGVTQARGERFFRFGLLLELDDA